MIEEIITFFVPGILWFYYGFQDDICKAPIDEGLASLVNCYFTISLFLLFPALNMCSKKICDDFCCIPFLYFIYLLGKLVLLIIMLAIVQTAYYKNWDDNICDGLEGWTLAWLVVNYIMLGCTFIYSLFFMGVAFCDCDYDFDEYLIDY